MLSAGEGEALGFGDAHGLVLKADGAATGDRFVLNEHRMAAGETGPRPHHHSTMIDSFYVLEGALTLWLDGERVSAPAGSFVLVPPGVVHTFANEAAQPVRFLGLSAPAGLDAYLRETSAAPDDPDIIAEIASRHDIFFD